MVGLGTMGRNLSFNLAENGYSVAGLATSDDKARNFEQLANGLPVQGFSDPKAFVASIRKPRPIMLLVPAGQPVDDVIAEMKPLLEKDDLLIDGGNSYFKDTDRRSADLESMGFGFFGMGVSGGEEGARHGPSMMPGGNARLWERVRPLLEKVSAKAEDGAPCVALMGPHSSGHYVKTVHNGIEYALMQGISEIYDGFSTGLGLNNAEIADIFEEWDGAELKSFLMHISTTVLRYTDPGTGHSLVDLISDKAKQKGTGKWTSQDAMDLGVPVPSIDISVAARELSGYKDDRVTCSKIYESLGLPALNSAFRGAARNAMMAAMAIAYAQGFSQLSAASAEYGYDLKMEKVASIWRAGCIIRSAFLQQITHAFTANPQLPNLLMDAEVAEILKRTRVDLRAVVNMMTLAGLPCPMLGSSLAYFDGIRRAKLPTNLIQAQRDFFGAHTYERIDQPGIFHTQWETGA